MRRIDTANRHVDKFGAGKHGFRNGDPLTATPATAMIAEWFDHAQEEIARVVEASGAALDNAKFDQLLTAIFKLASKNMQAFAVSGNFVVPANVTRVRVKCWGGGGGGSGVSGGSGGGGGYSEGFVNVNPGDSIVVTVGGGGAAGSSGGNSGAGGTSSFGAFMSATGGGASLGAGGAGGVGVGGTVNLVGGDGDDIGGGGNSVALGGDAAGGGGTGGSGRDDGNGAAGIGNQPGGGGAAHPSTAAGGVGGAGLVLVYW